MTGHRHTWTVTRRERNTGHPLIRSCTCGEVQRWFRGRWTITNTGRGA
jgi:hypothetical protein